MLKRLKKVDYVESNLSNSYSATQKLKRLLMLDKSFKEEKEKIDNIKEKEKNSFNSLRKIFLFARLDGIVITLFFIMIMNLVVLSFQVDSKDYIENKFESLNLSLKQSKEKIFHQFVNKELLGQELTLTEKYNLFETFLIDNKFEDVSKKIDTFKLGESDSEKGDDILYMVQRNEKIKDDLNFSKNIFLFLLLFCANYIYFIPFFSNLFQYKRVKKESEKRKIEIYFLSTNINYFEVAYLNQWDELNISEEKLTFKEFYEKYYINEQNSELDNKLTKLAIIESVPDKVIYKNIFTNKSSDFSDVDLKTVEENIQKNLSLKNE